MEGPRHGLGREWPSAQLPMWWRLRSPQWTGLARGWQSPDGFAGRLSNGPRWARCEKVFGSILQRSTSIEPIGLNVQNRFAPSSIINARCRRDRNDASGALRNICSHRALLTQKGCIKKGGRRCPPRWRCVRIRRDANTQIGQRPFFWSSRLMTKSSPWRGFLI